MKYRTFYSSHAVLGLVAALTTVHPVWGQPEPGAAQASASAEASPPQDPKVEQARATYTRGMRHVKAAQWGEALAAFERSSQLRPHPLTTYNIGACERALGRYTRARARFQAALTQEGRLGELPQSIREEARGFLAEIDKLLVRLHVKLVPGSAGIAVDGRALTRSSKRRSSYVAGLARPGPGKRTASGSFELVMDPGARVLTLSRKGYADVVLNKSYSPGYRGKLRLELQRLPATIHVSASEPDALVTVGGRDVGPAPVDVLRPPGKYVVTVTKDEFDPYSAEVRVNAGEESTLRAQLVREETPLTGRWWFWTAAAAVVGAVAVGTYYATRTEPEPERPPLDGGSLSWVAPIP